MTGNWARSFSLFRHPSDSKSVDTVFEHEELMMFSNDGGLPDCDMIVTNFLGSELNGVKANNDLTMVIYHLWRPSLLITMSWKRMQMARLAPTQLGDVTVSDQVEVVGTFMVKFFLSTFSISEANY
jgi:hypothetical protein